MKPSTMYAQSTAKGCQETLNIINGLDNDVTIGELKDFLQKRIKIANDEFAKAKEELIKCTQGKCYKIVYSKEHSVLLKIDSVKIIDEYGYPEAIMVGEQIVNYNGEIRCEILKIESNKKYSNYFIDDNQEEFDVKDFNKLMGLYQQIKF